jgi:hypothetical protein
MPETVDKNNGFEQVVSECHRMLGGLYVGSEFHGDLVRRFKALLASNKSTHDLLIKKCKELNYMKARLAQLEAIEEAAKGICNPCESCLKPCKSSHQCAWRSAFIKLQALLSSPAAPEPEQPSTETCPMCAAFHDDCFGAIGTSKCVNPERYKEPLNLSGRSIF